MCCLFLCLFVCVAEGNTVASCAISRMQAISFMKDLLLNKQKRVEIWATEGKNIWTLKRKVCFVCFPPHDAPP